LLFFTENLGFLCFFSSVFFGLLIFFCFFRFVFICFETICFDCFASLSKQRVSMFRLNRNKLKTHPNSLKESIFGYFSANLGLFRFVSVCFGLLRNSSVCFGCFDIGLKHRNKAKYFVFGFTKQTETNAKEILFWFVSVRKSKFFFVCFQDTLAHLIPLQGFCVRQEARLSQH
jgi:hypothetical protein